MYEQYGDEIEFFIVYIREAHALDSPVPNLQGPLLEDPISFIERASTASRCTEDLHLPMPALVDGMDDLVNRNYQGHPDRLFLVGVDGRISYAGARGPRGFVPDDLEAAIEVELKRSDRPRRRASL
jgi:hypothetical protein